MKNAIMEKLKRRIAVLVTAALTLTTGQPVLADNTDIEGPGNAIMTAYFPDEQEETIYDTDVEGKIGQPIPVGYVNYGDYVIVSVNNAILETMGKPDSIEAVFYGWNNEDLYAGKVFKHTTDSYAPTNYWLVVNIKGDDESKPLRRWKMSVVFSQPDSSAGISVSRFIFEPVELYHVRIDRSSLKGPDIEGLDISPDSFSPGDGVEFIEITGLSDTAEYEFIGYDYKYDIHGEDLHTAGYNNGKYKIPVGECNSDITIYAKWRKKSIATTAQIICPDGKNCVRLSNTVENGEGRSLTNDNASAQVLVKVDPSTVNGDITLEADDAGFYGMDTNEAEAKKDVSYGSMVLPYAEPSEGVQTRTFYVAASKSGFNDTEDTALETEGRRAGKATVTASLGGTVLGSFAIYVDGYDSVDKTFYENGTVVKDAVRNVGKTAYYFDKEGRLAKASKAADEYENNAGKWSLYVNKEGKIAKKGIFRVAGINRLFNEEGRLIEYSDTNEGKIVIGGVAYYVHKDTGEAHISVKWGLENVDWTVTYNDTADSAKAVFYLKSDTLSVDDVSVSADKIELVSSNEVQKTFRASLKYEGCAFEDEKTVYSHTDHKWTVSFNWISVSLNMADTNVTAEARCTEGGERTDLFVKVDKNAIGSKIEYTASVTDPGGKVWKSKKNIDKNGNVKDGPAGYDLVEGGDIAIIGLNEEGYPYTGKKIVPSFYVTDDGVVLAEAKDYSVQLKDNIKVGRAKIEVKGKGNYAGKSTSVSFEIYDPVAKAAKEGTELSDGSIKSIGNIAAVTYNGKAQYPDNIVVTMKDKSVITMKHNGNGEYVNASDDKNAKQLLVSVTNNVDKGTATVAVAASNGTIITKNFSIKAADIGTAKVAEDMEVTFSVKGARPDKIGVTFTNADGDQFELLEGQDFTVNKINGNKNVGTATLELKGKGNFTKTNGSGSFRINPLKVDSIAGITAYEGQKAKSVKVLIPDDKGVSLPAKFLNVTIKKEDGEVLPEKTPLSANDKYTVTVESKNSNVEIVGDYINKEFSVAANIGKAKINAKNLSVTYTGKPIELTNEQLASVIITIKVNGINQTLVAGEDYRVIGYTNNVNKGSMTVTIEGTGAKTARGTFSGTKTFKINIKGKELGDKK